MNADDFARSLFVNVQRYVDAAVPLVVRQVLQQERMKFAGPRGEKGDTGLQGPAGPQGERGERGADGATVTTDDMRVVVAEALKGIELPRGEPGESGIGIKAVEQRDGNLIVRLSDGTEHNAGRVVGEPGTPGRDGEPGPQGEIGPAGESIAGPPGAPGEKGMDGRDADPEAIATMVAKAVADMPPPKDGRDGRDGKDGRDGIATRDELDAAIKSLWSQTAESMQADMIERVKSALPDLRLCGIWKEGEHYREGNLVVNGGSLFYCNETGTTDRIGDGSKGWTLVAKRGRDGRDLRDVPPPNSKTDVVRFR